MRVPAGGDDMSRPALWVLSLFASALSFAPAAAQTIASRYTSVDTRRCRTLEIIPEGDSVRRRCPGLAGINLYVNEGDGRSEIDAGADDGQWESLPAFNTIGDRIEWRLSDGRPFAIIYRLRTSASPDHVAGSALVVERIGRGPAAPGCRLGIVDGALPEANARARSLADAHMRDMICPVVSEVP
jgi:hypothetical protein